MARSVTVIPARNRQVSGYRAAPQKKIRVAAYCRVSTDQEDQLHSFEAQVDYYTKYINDHENYEMPASMRMRVFREPIRRRGSSSNV